MNEKFNAMDIKPTTECQMKAIKSTHLILASLLLCMGQMTNSSLGASTPATVATNSTPRAATPVPKEKQGWMVQHDQNVALARKGNIDVLFIGDSITRCWSREGHEIWAAHYVKKQAANFGISGDCTEHVLWRLQHGELENIKPKVVVLLIGTNNIGQHDSPADIAQAITAIIEEIRQRSPDTRILLLGVLPNHQAANHPNRETIREINRHLAPLHDGKHVTYLDIGGKLLQPDGSLSTEVTKDFTHLTSRGYEIFAEAIDPTLEALLRKP
jgi:lysophospholipase L1-like esterase